MNFDQLFLSFASMKVAVVGDVMLDTYWWGNVDRISPEAPVPVVALHRKDWRLGGSGNVALNTVAMGAPTTLFSVIGADDDGSTLLSLLQHHRIDTSNIVQSTSRLTTNKTRIISRNQHMMRLDAEMIHDINPGEEEALLNRFKNYLEKELPAVVIFEDYNKGVLTPRVIGKMLAECNQRNIVTTVDPKRKNFFAYKGATIFKPNLKEVTEALNILPDTINQSLLSDVHHRLFEQLQHDISLITLSEKGVFFNSGSTAGILPTFVRNISDVSGAGDTVIAVASLVYAGTKDIQLAANMANLAGGLVCEEVGTVAINREKLLSECKACL